MGTKFGEVVCDEHGIGGDREHCGDNDAHLGRINVFYREASGGMSVPRAVFFDLEPGVIGAAALSRRSAVSELFCPGNFVNQNAGAGNNWAEAHYTKAGHEFR
jgi:tubulin beta